MSTKADANPVATAGCVLAFTAIAITAIIYGKVDVAGWFKPSPVGRYQVVSGRVHNVFTTDEVPAMVKIDTATGKSWVYFPEEVSSGPMHLELANRWEEIHDPAPSPSPTKSP